MREVYFTTPAARDLEAIIAYIALDNPQAAEGFFRDISQLINRLVAFPNLGRRGRVAGTREVILGSAPYAVAYRPTTAKITVLAVFHLARDLRYRP